MGKFERFLTLWVTLCIIVGIGLGQAVPGVFHALGAATVAQVNLPVAVLVWLMIVPMLLKIDLAALGQVGNHWRGRCHVVEIWMQVRRVPQLRSRRGNDFMPRLHGRCPEGSVRSCLGEMALDVERVVGGCVG